MVDQSQIHRHPPPSRDTKRDAVAAIFSQSRSVTVCPDRLLNFPLMPLICCLYQGGSGKGQRRALGGNGWGTVAPINPHISGDRMVLMTYRSGGGSGPRAGQVGAIDRHRGATELHAGNVPPPPLQWWRVA